MGSCFLFLVVIGFIVQQGSRTGQDVKNREPKLSACFAVHFGDAVRLS
uniref:Uncharacterized protein n=1 Tax=Faecalibaculum rodentium TaxID=1702221 RepID=A0A140DVZ5_9FIRM|nr:hypothetical protein AALO17_16880 [Faecalibaculum rodentium]